MPLRGGLIDYASWGVVGPLAALPELARGVGEILAGRLAGQISSVSVTLRDGRRADRALMRPLTWDGRSVGAIVALRTGRPFFAGDGPTLDEVARLAAIDLYAAHQRSQPSGGPPTTVAPPAAATVSPAPVAAVAPAARSRTLVPWAPVAATVVAQVLAADGAIAALDPRAAASVDGAAGWLALALAAAVQGLALLSLRRRGALRPLLALLLLAFVAAAMSVPLVSERPGLLALRLGEAGASLATALYLARRLRRSP